MSPIKRSWRQGAVHLFAGGETDLIAPPHGQVLAFESEHLEVFQSVGFHKIEEKAVVLNVIHEDHGPVGEFWRENGQAMGTAGVGLVAVTGVISSTELSLFLVISFKPILHLALIIVSNE